MVRLERVVAPLLTLCAHHIKEGLHEGTVSMCSSPDKGDRGGRDGVSVETHSQAVLFLLHEVMGC